MEEMKFSPEAPLSVERLASDYDEDDNWVNNLLGPRKDGDQGDEDDEYRGDEDDEDDSVIDPEEDRIELKMDDPKFALIATSDKTEFYKAAFALDVPCTRYVIPSFCLCLC